MTDLFKKIVQEEKSREVKPFQGRELQEPEKPEQKDDLFPIIKKGKVIGWGRL